MDLISNELVLYHRVDRSLYLGKDQIKSFRKKITVRRVAEENANLSTNQ